ncbi:MAG: hypothetical protein RL454_489, partial [Actinomycetota bacterium]
GTGNQTALAQMAADELDADWSRFAVEFAPVESAFANNWLAKGFVGEMAGDPFWVRMRQAHWTSGDAIHWKRQATLMETSGQPMTVTRRPYESLWATMPVFNDANLTPKDKKDIITYLVYLQDHPSPAGLDLENLGPVAEGLFVWIFVLGGIIAITVWLGAKSN